MKNTLVWLAIILVGTHSAFAADLPADWKNVQTVELPKPGVLKFSLPAVTLDACRKGLEDLRLFDDHGRELPFLIERPLEDRPPILPARAFETSQRPETTIVTMDTRTDRPVRAVNLMTPMDKFHKIVTVEGSTNGTTWQTLAKGEPIFRELSGTRRLLLEFPPAVYESLRVTIAEPPGGIRLHLSGAEIHVAPEGPNVIEALNLTITERSTVVGNTVLKLKSPTANFTLADLNLEVSDSSFMRVIRLAAPTRDDKQLKENEFWRDTIYRVPVANHPTATKLGVTPNQPIIGRELIVTIENAKQAPLNITGISANRRPVYLIVPVSEAGKYHLLSGNPSAAQPSYDLAALRNSGAGELLNTVAISPLTLNPARGATSPSASTGPESGNWKYRKRLEFAGGDWHEVELDLDVLTHSTRLFQDLRVVRDGKTIPCTIQVGPALTSVTPTVTMEKSPTSPTTSQWTIKLPRAGLPLTQLECTTPVNAIKRVMQLSERGQATAANLGHATWIRLSDEPTGRMSMTVTRTPQTDLLRLTTDNGTNGPITLDNFQVWYPRAHLIFQAPSGADTFLYYGNADAGTPPASSRLAQPPVAAGKSPAKLAREEALLVRQPFR